MRKIPGNKTPFTDRYSVPCLTCDSVEELTLMTWHRQLRLGAFMRPVSLHIGAWRYPVANVDFAHLKV
jgi:hypothetical protein